MCSECKSGYGRLDNSYACKKCANNYYIPIFLIIIIILYEQYQIFVYSKLDP